MSIEVMSRVWKHSKAYSGYLLVLLAIADHADDEGQAYPSIAGVAHKSRMTERQVHRALVWLVESGELSVGYKQGPNGKNLYSIKVEAPPKRGSNPGTLTNCHRDVDVSAKNGDVTVTPTSGLDPDVGVTVSPESPESSVNKNKVSNRQPLNHQYPPKPPHTGGQSRDREKSLEAEAEPDPSLVAAFGGKEQKAGRCVGYPRRGEPRWCEFHRRSHLVEGK